MSALVERPDDIRLAMLGMVEGNGHPYSWSAIFNGYDEEVMAECPYPVIPEYLGKEPKETLQIEGARVTHIWTDDPADAEHVSRASLIPNVVDSPEDVIGEVDAAIIATDIGHEHVDRCRPFIEAGLPVFVDKPLVDNAEDLATFKQWRAGGAKIMSSSALRYSKEIMPYRISTNNLGSLRYITITMAKTWERYGIHALEAVYPIVGPGFLSVRNTGSEERNIVHLRHECGADVVIATITDLYGAFGVLMICGTEDYDQLSSMDTFYAFKSQLQAFVEYLRSGELPFPFAETEELMRIIIAGIRSRDEGGREVALDEIEA
ncbi:MAG: Gfo/Idh/MocA family oxidoreductase [Armatimonadota bacterium]|nr:Gfo/Idh/MocA family oxidoreductase [Armatimonadota bacterium]